MQLITKKSLIASAAERSRAANQVRGNWVVIEGKPSAEVIYNTLRNLPADAAEAQIIEITGDDRWTANICDECGNDRETTVMLGEEIHHPIDALIICDQCLGKAAHLVLSK